MRSEDSHVITHYYPAILEGSLTLLVVASPSNRPTPRIEASVPITATTPCPIAGHQKYFKLDLRHGFHPFLGRAGHWL